MAHAPVRREGFAGQHHVIVPVPVRRSTGKHLLLEGLFVTDAGYFPQAEGHRVERPQGAATHLMIICVHGEGWAQCGPRRATLAPGDLAWLPADMPHAYGSSEEKPWSIVWAHFTGRETAAWLGQLSSDKTSGLLWLSFGRHNATTLGLEKVYAELETGYSLQQLLAASAALRTVFCRVMEKINSSGAAKTAAERTAAVRDEIIASPARAYRLNELAAAAGLSVPHFCVLFKKQTGYTPIDFLIRQRIRTSCRLLDTTASTIASIATEVGFDDPYYFSRCFHRVMGSSPRDYRKMVKG